MRQDHLLMARNLLEKYLGIPRTSANFTLQALNEEDVMRLVGSTSEEAELFIKKRFTLHEPKPAEVPQEPTVKEVTVEDKVMDEIEADAIENGGLDL